MNHKHTSGQPQTIQRHNCTSSTRHNIKPLTRRSSYFTRKTVTLPPHSRCTDKETQPASDVRQTPLKTGLQRPPRRCPTVIWVTLDRSRLAVDYTLFRLVPTKSIQIESSRVAKFPILQHDCTPFWLRRLWTSLHKNLRLSLWWSFVESMPTFLSFDLKRRRWKWYVESEEQILSNDALYLQMNTPVRSLSFAFSLAIKEY